MSIDRLGWFADERRERTNDENPGHRQSQRPCGRGFRTVLRIWCQRQNVQEGKNCREQKVHLLSHFFFQCSLMEIHHSEIIGNISGVRLSPLFHVVHHESNQSKNIYFHIKRCNSPFGPFPLDSLFMMIIVWFFLPTPSPSSSTRSLPPSTSRCRHSRPPEVGTHSWKIIRSFGPKKRLSLSSAGWRQQSIQPSSTLACLKPSDLDSEERDAFSVESTVNLLITSIERSGVET